MAETAETQIPPYPSYATFDNCIKGLARTGVPNRIDKSLFPKLSGGAQSSLLSALRYLNLIADDGSPKPALEDLAATSEQERPAVMAKIMKDAYKFVFDGKFDLSKATSAELAERFKSQKAGGGTLEKAIAFFLAGATAAGIAVSPHIQQRKHTSNGTPRKARTPKPKGKGGEIDPGKTDDDTPPQLSVAEQLLAKFPQMDPNWPEAVQAKWFDAFQRLMDAAGVKK